MAPWLLITVNLLISLSIIVVLILVHEIGHFLVAKISKTRVAEFSIGFGPAIIQRKWGETTYSLRWIPFGGYVSVVSDDVIQNIEEIKKHNPTEEEIKLIEKKLYGIKLTDEFNKSDSLNSKSYPTRVVFALGGVMMNFLLAWSAIFASYLISGKEVELNKMQISVKGKSTDNSTLKQEEIYYGFTIEKIYYQNVNSSEENVISGENYSDIFYFFKDDNKFINNEIKKVFYIKLGRVHDQKWDENISEDKISISYLGNDDSSPKYNVNNQWTYDDELNGKFVEFNTVDIPLQLESNKIYRIKSFEHYNGWKSLGIAFVDTWIKIGEMFVFIFDVLTLGYVVDDNLPWRYSYQGESAKDINSYNWAGYVAELSAVLFAFNVIPLPPLDGFMVVNWTYEIIRKRKIDKDLLQVLYYIGYSFIAITFIFSFIVV